MTIAVDGPHSTPPRAWMVFFVPLLKESLHQEQKAVFIRLDQESTVNRYKG